MSVDLICFNCGNAGVKCVVAATTSSKFAFKVTHKSACFNFGGGEGGDVIPFALCSCIGRGALSVSVAPKGLTCHRLASLSPLLTVQELQTSIFRRWPRTRAVFGSKQNCVR